MTCREFEQILQQQADGCPPPCAEALLRKHAQTCSACRELEDGFRFIAQGFAVSRVPAPSRDLTDRIVAAVVRDRLTPARSRTRLAWLAAAASLIAAVGLWAWQSKQREIEPATVAVRVPITAHTSPSPDDPLFPELADATSGDPRDGIVFVEAVEPVTEIFRAVGRSLGSPVRPIAANATEALSNLIKEIPEPDSPMMSMPGMREIMPQPMKKKMGEMGPS
jgi:hypothetical protein